jgi:hypothetical protein
MKLINKDDLVAEIESLKRITFTNFDEGVNCAVQTLLEIIDTLEVKDVDLEKQIGKYLDVHNIEYGSQVKLFDFAKHFFELGLKVQKGE